MALDPRVYVLTEADIGCTFKVTVTPVRSDGAKVRGVIGELLAPVLLGPLSTVTQPHQHTVTRVHPLSDNPALAIPFGVSALCALYCMLPRVRHPRQRLRSPWLAQAHSCHCCCATVQWSNCGPAPLV